MSDDETGLCHERIPRTLLPDERVGTPLCTLPAGHDGPHQHDHPVTAEHLEWDNSPGDAYHRGYAAGRSDLAAEMAQPAAAVKEALRAR